MSIKNLSSSKDNYFFTAELVILSHETNCAAMRVAVDKLAQLDSTERVASVLRVEDLEDDE